LNFCVVIIYDNYRCLQKKEFSEKIGLRIKQLRKTKNISQAELGRICLKDRQHIELIENNKVSANVYTLYLISLALRVEVDELFKFEELD
jgi:putative transcriptional regulator